MDVGILYFLKLWLDYLGISNFRTTPNLILLKCLYLLSGEGISRLATRPSCFNRWSETCKAPSTPWSQKSSIQERSFNEHQLVYAGRWVTFFFWWGYLCWLAMNVGELKIKRGFNIKHGDVTQHDSLTMVVSGTVRKKTVNSGYHYHNQWESSECTFFPTIFRVVGTARLGLL